MIRKLITGVIAFFLLMLALSYPIAYYITNHFHTYNKQNWILHQRDLQLDYAVLGSSRVFNMVDIRTLDLHYQKKGINLGTSGSCYAENFVILSEFISKNKINTLLLNTDEFCFNPANSYNHPFHEYEFLPLTSKYDYVFADYTPLWKRKLWKLVPATKYMEYNGQYTLKNVAYPTNDLMGTELFANKKQTKPFNYKKKIVDFNAIDLKYFFKIIHLCAVNNIKVILITTPIYTPNNEVRNAHFTNYITAASKKLNIPYYSYEQLLDCSNRNYFKDYIHTNATGSKEYSANLGKALKQHDR